MPELPEVETTIRGIEPYVLHKKITRVVVREPRLRWPVPEGLERLVSGCSVERIFRRAKYILMSGGSGHLLLHLGMSGSLRLSPMDNPPELHDHVEFQIENEWKLRLRDPRRFGCVLYLEGNPHEHPLLANLGPEPISDEFDGNYLYAMSRKRSVAIKNFLMNSKVVVGVGNIYASEALYGAGIHPLRQAGRISIKRYELLADNVKTTLNMAIEAGGTTLQDFVSGLGKPGYFRHELQVYDRENQPCFQCGLDISRIIIGQRSSYYCKNCQT